MITEPLLDQLLRAIDVPAAGSTPAADTLRALRGELATLARSARVSIVLVTDGGMSCTRAPACDADSCLTNIESTGPCRPTSRSCCIAKNHTGAFCLDVEEIVQAAAALADSHIATYVIGVDPLDRYVPILAAIAAAGHTARSPAHPFYEARPEGRAAVVATLLEAVPKEGAVLVPP